MSEERLNELFSKVNDGYSSIQELEIRDYITNLQQKVETKQKEFIKFLEDNYKETQDIWYIKILQKYKSIIGSDSEC